MRRLIANKIMIFNHIKRTYYSSLSGNPNSFKNVRKSFIGYFESYNHQHIPSSSVIPKKDEGSYFINAGMNQFKPIFLGTVDPASDMANLKRVVNSQKCIRVGGKHNDLKDVGKDSYHHTFFEMLGSWSFGDYFKKEACMMAWELLTDVYKLPKEHLYVSYFGGDKHLNIKPDLECREVWLEIGVPAERIIAFGAGDNFWDMGSSGPCGPSTEIHYDHAGLPNPHARLRINSDCSAMVEIWNLVFMQFERHLDGSIHPLPQHHVDTGMGLERLTAVLQGTTDNYNTDIFSPLFKHLHQSSGAPAYSHKYSLSDDQCTVDIAYRVIADHIRMATVALADGLRPGPKDADSKLRYVIHRCIRQAKEVLNAPQGTVGSLVPIVADLLGDFYPEIAENAANIEDIINHTEARYLNKLEESRKTFLKAMKEYDPTGKKCLSGEQMMDLVIHGMNLDILGDLAESYQVTLEMEAFEQLIQKDRNDGIILDRNSNQPTVDDVVFLSSNHIPATDDSFVYSCDTVHHGQYEFEPLAATVLAIKQGGKFVKEITSNCDEICLLVTDKTNFYAEKGGQIGDSGLMRTNDGSEFEVQDVQPLRNYVFHIGVLKSGRIRENCDVTMSIDEEKRVSCMRNHTATHILNYCLWQVLGKIRQQGSLVNHNKLTFTFSMFSPSQKFTSRELEEITLLANSIIRDKMKVYREEVDFKTSNKLSDLRYLEDTVYPATVKVISIGSPFSELIKEETTQSSKNVPQSVELCAGTHVDNTGDIEEFVITGVESGTNTISAVTGAQAVQVKQNGEKLRLKCDRLKSLVNDKKNLSFLNSEMKEIEKILGAEQLPKLDRDYVLAEIDTFVRRLSKAVSYKQELKSVCEEELKTADKVLVKFIGSSNVRDVVSVISSLTLHVPIMILFTRSDKKTSHGPIYGVSHIPGQVVETEGLTVDQWMTHISSNLGINNDLVHPKPKPQFSKGRDMRVLNTRLKYKPKASQQESGVENDINNNCNNLDKVINKAKDYFIKDENSSSAMNTS